jgi:oligoribonuclease NrnB/cAMP/cGMP phosphodiesterase (DHH superfamily)
MTDLIVFTHNDLDALGSMINIEYRMPSIQKKYFFTNYANIPKQVDDIIDYAEKNKVTRLLIPDVSFGDSKESLRRLYNHFEKITHIDHHLYPEGFWDEFPNMKVVHDKTKCAAKLCNEFFGNTGKNKNLDKLTYIIDIYDLWQTDSPIFDFSQDLNEYFWAYDIELLCKKIIQNDFKLPDDFKETVQNIKDKYTQDIAKYENEGQIKRARDISFCFIADWFNQVLIQEMKNGQNFVIGMNSWGLVRVRIRKESPYSDEQKDRLRKALTGTTTTGHMNCFTYKIEGNPDYKQILEEAGKIDAHLQEIF